MIRSGQTQMAEDVINDLRDSWPARWTRDRFRVEVVLDPVELTGDLEADLRTLASELIRETWLSGTRQETLRRFVREFGDDTAMDLYPVRNGDDECWPVTEQETVGASP